MRSLAAFSLILVFALPAAAAPSQDIPTETPPPPAAAELRPAEPGVIELFREFELFGTFAPNCSQPPAPTNPHVSVRQQDGNLVIEAHDVGPEYATNLYGVRAARRLGKDRLEIKVVFAPSVEVEEFQTLELQIGKGTRRTLLNRVDGGVVRVRRGVAVANGSKTPLLKRCE